MTFKKYSVILAVLITALLSSFSPALSSAQAKPLFVDVIDYDTQPRREGCRENEWAKKYPDCVDHKAVFKQATENAAERTLPLMLLWGFDACPGCQALARTTFAGAGPQSEDFVAILGEEQRKTFFEITGGTNQIALLHIRSKGEARTGLAEEIGANDIGRSKGNISGVWSPMWMAYNTDDQSLASQSILNGYGFCNFEQLMAYNLIGAGALPVNPDFAEFCTVKSRMDKADVRSAEKACKKGDNYECIAFALHELSEGKITNEDNIANFKPACEYGSGYACYAMAQSYAALQQKPDAQDYARESCRLGHGDGCRYAASLN